MDFFSKIYDKRDDIDFFVCFWMVMFLAVLLMVFTFRNLYIRFARVWNHDTNFNARNKVLTAKLLQQGYRYHKIRKHFLIFIADTMD